MNTFGCRLKISRKNSNLSQEKVCLKIGIKQGTLSELENDLMVKSTYTIALAELYKVNAVWLATGKGVKELNKPVLLKSSLSKLNSDGIVIEHYDAEGSMGQGIILKDQSGVICEWQVSEDWVRLNIKNYTNIDNLKIVTGFGDSMQGMFNSGDPLIIDIGVKIADRDSPYFFRVGNEGFIKRLQHVPGVGLRAISANKEYESWTITEDMDFEIFGIVLKSWQSNSYN